MTLVHGFELIREHTIPELNTRARIWQHTRTGAELLSLENDDENKVFGIVFRTPPPDSTGLPHIMEHAVLGGSQKYPLKEPFVELIKGSLASFVNAMTSPDKTSYPVASTNLQDFYNLIDVYLDAVFHPLITPQHLQREGWHYETDGPDNPLIYKGIVFNEMKGAYSSPDSVLYRRSTQALFPDTPYSHDYGGDPVYIPDLTYEQFKEFHETYYHPSNAYIFFYGDDDPEERLRLMDAYLRDYSPIETDSAVPLQPFFDAPRRHTFPYSVAADEDAGRKAYVQLNWMLPEATDPALVMALEILSHALIDTPASPLRKALIDSGLGEDLTGGGYSTYTRQATFSAGLKGVDRVDVDRVETLILDTLQQLAAEGFDPEMIEAAVNTIEFQLRENNTGRYPRGLALMFRSLDTWLHGRDPLAPLAYEAPLTTVKERLAAKPDYLQDLIQVYLLDNPHRVTVVLEPDPDLAARQDAAEKARLAEARASMGPDDVQAIAADVEELKRFQETPDPPELLARLPRLKLEDLDRNHKPIPMDVASVEGSKVLFHDLFTNGIVYLDLGFDLHPLPADLLPLVGLFGQALLEMGTETEDFVKLSQRIGRKTGGIIPATLVSAVRNSDDSTAWLMLRAKSTLAQAPDMLAILRDVLLTTRLDNRERFRQIVLEAKAGHETGLVPMGHAVVNTRLRAHLNQADWVNEQIDGVEQLFALRRLAEAVERDWPQVLAQLETVRDLLINRLGMIANVTFDAAGYREFAPQLAEFLAGLPGATPQAVSWPAPAFPSHEGLAIPAQVNYVAKGANLYDLGYRLDGSISVVTNYLRTSWLWDKIRVQGGAYGGMCAFNHRTGIFTYLSYRDPNLVGTVANYDGTADFLRRADLSAEELTSNIIGAIGTIDAYQLPDAKGFTSLNRYLTGETDELLQQYRDEVLSTTETDFRSLADALEQVNTTGRVVVMGAQEALEEAGRQGLSLSIVKVL